jgi:hypothetical protein
MASFTLYSASSQKAGLPDGLFANQKSQFGSNLEGLRIENVGIFYGHFEDFTATRNIL